MSKRCIVYSRNEDAVPRKTYSRRLKACDGSHWSAPAYKDIPGPEYLPRPRFSSFNSTKIGSSESGASIEDSASTISTADTSSVEENSTYSSYDIDQDVSFGFPFEMKPARDDDADSDSEWSVRLADSYHLPHKPANRCSLFRFPSQGSRPNSQDQQLLQFLSSAASFYETRDGTCEMKR
eukprot:Filipodium_phascolosomae@DN991_c0_g1_i1.p1